MNKAAKNATDNSSTIRDILSDVTVMKDYEGVKPNYAKIRSNYILICLVSSIFVLILQIALFIVFKFELMPIYFKTSEFVHLLKYLIIPSGLNFSAVLFAYLMNKYYKGSEFILNMCPIIAITVICSSIASAHSVYSITIMVMALPMLMVSVFGQRKLLYATACFCVIGFDVAALCRMVSPYWHDSVDTKFVPEVSGAFMFLIVAFFISLTMVNLLKTQRDRLITAVEDAEVSRAEALEANNAKSEFLANMSHEIRTPLNAITGLTEVIMHDPQSPNVGEYAQDIQRSSNLLLSIVNDILDLSKIESGSIEITETNYELGSLLIESFAMIQARITDKGLKAKLTCDPTLPRLLRGDEYHLRQVLMNLLSNAAKYTDHGRVELVVSGEAQGNKLDLIMSVRDTGVGISPEDIPQLFDKFTRMDMAKNRSIEGTGLGLNITKKLMDLMGGSIQVESVPNLGSSFTVHVPQTIVDAEPIGDINVRYDEHTQVESYTQSFEAPDAKILVVDDIPLNLRVIEKLLEPTKVQVDLARSGAECLDLARDHAYDLVLMDHMMPGMDGVETLEKLRKLTGSPNAGIPVVMLTANAMAGAESQYLDLGFTDYLSKPVQGARLEATVLKYLPDDKVTIRK